MIRFNLIGHGLAFPLSFPLSTLSVRGLLCPIAAGRHAAPSSPMAAGPIEKEKRTGRPFASFHIGEVLGADEVRERSCEWEEQRFGGFPASLQTPSEARGARVFSFAPVANGNLTKLFVAGQQLIERVELVHCIRRKRPSHIFVDKRLEPISQRPRLRRDGIEFASSGASSQILQDALGNQFCLLEPDEKIVSRSEPLDFGVHRDCESVQKVQSAMVGNEKRRRTRICHRSFAKSATCLDIMEK
jgi:hypothetical protein